MEVNTKIDITSNEYTKLISLFNDFEATLNESERDLLNKVKTSITEGWEIALKWEEAYLKVKEILAEQTFSPRYRNNSDAIKGNLKLKEDLSFENDRRQGILKELLNEYIDQEEGEEFISNTEIVKPKTVSDLVDLIISKLKNDES